MEPTTGENAHFANAFLENQANFAKSGVPARVLFFNTAVTDSSKWIDFSEEIVEVFRRHFASKSAAVLVEIDGKAYVADFKRMLLIKPGAGCMRSIAWIDEGNMCFFPRRVADCGCWNQGSDHEPKAVPVAAEESSQGARFIPEIPDLNA